MNQACEGSAHASGLHGHDGRGARYATLTACDACGFTTRLNLCAGRVSNMLNSGAGVKCAGCGRLYEDVNDLVTVHELPRHELAVQPLPRAASGEVLARFRSDQLARGHSEVLIRNRMGVLATLEREQGDLLSLRHDQLTAFLGRDGVAQATRRTYYSHLRAFYGFAHAAGILQENPAAALPKAKMPRGKPRPFSRDQIERLLNSGAYANTRAMIVLGYYQGFRVSSIARVHGHDIDLDAGTIVTTVKGGKVRSLPLHPVVAELAENMPRDGYWFPARNGAEGHIQSAAVTNLITLAKKRAGITDRTLTPHSLRHSFASHLVEEGVDIRVVQELMTHDDLSSTQVYAGVSGRRIRDGLTTLPIMTLPTRSHRKGSTHDDESRT